MATKAEILQAIRNARTAFKDAIYGKDVRQGLVDVADSVYDAVNQWGTLIDDTLTQEGEAADAKAVGERLSNLGFTIIQPTGSETYTHKGITYTKENDKITVSGTAEAMSFYNILLSRSSLPNGIVAGGNYAIYISSNKVNADVFCYINGEATEVISSVQSPTMFTVPNGAEGFLFRLRVPKDQSVNEIVYPLIVNYDRYLDNLRKEFKKTNYNYGSNKLGYTNANEVAINSLFFVSESGSGLTMDNYPFNSAGWLLTTLIGDNGNTGRFQIAYPWRANETLKYRSYQSGTWNEWKGIGDNVYHETTVVQDTYNNTYNIATSPTITKDANSWLKSVDTLTEDETGKTDMSGAILSMLNDTGYCHLSEGVFYVSTPIDMPERTLLVGCGDKTIIKLLDSVASGYCVKLTKYCTVRDIRFTGSYSDITIDTEDIGGRNGIIITGSAQYDNRINNCWFDNFDGAGIYQLNTGGNTAGYLTVSDCYIYNCCVGLNIYRLSEYNKYTNVITQNCYYGCINNGGNNVFTSCTFHGVIGFLIDGTTNKPNTAHGSAIGCTFNHINNQNNPEVLGMGDAVVIRNVIHGFVFDGCQLWYGEIRLHNARGIGFNSCLIGGNTPEIEVSGNYGAFFSNCIFETMPNINVNAKTKFNNCYVGAVGENNDPVLIAT